MPSLSGEQGQIWMMSIPTKQGSEIELRGFSVECSLKLEGTGSGRDVKAGIATYKIKMVVQAVPGLYHGNYYFVISKNKVYLAMKCNTARMIIPAMIIHRLMLMDLLFSSFEAEMASSILWVEDCKAEII